MSQNIPSNLYIRCEKWIWASNTELKDVNFFSNAARSQADTRILSDFVLMKSNPTFSYQKEDVDRNDIDQSLKLFGSFNTLKLDLSNLIKPGLLEYLNFFNATGNYLVRYLVKAYEGGKLIFQGVLSPQDIDYFNPAKVQDRETLSIAIYSWEKEFRDYYSEKSLPHENELTWTSASLGFDYISIEAFLLKLFNLNNVVFDNGIYGNASLRNWNLVKEPHFFAPGNFNGNAKHFWWFMTGYATIKYVLDLNCFDLLKKLCNAMGWIFYFKVVENEMRFVLQNRCTSAQFLGARNFNFSDLISYNISYLQFDQRITALKLPVIELTGGNDPFFGKGYLKGARDYVTSVSGKDPSINLIHFNHANLNEGASISLERFDGVTTSKYDFNDDKVHRYKEYKNYNLFESASYEYKTVELLPVDGGHSDWQMKSKYKINIDTNEFGYFDEGATPFNPELVYTGNVGTMMFRKDTDINDCTRYITLYNDNYLKAKNYIGTEQFKKNMRALLSQSDNLVIECEVNGFYPFPDEIISFTNASAPFNQSFEILSIEADYNRKTTNYKLRKKNV